MTTKELKYQLALGTVDFDYFNIANIQAITNYKLYRKLYNLYLIHPPLKPQNKDYEFYCAFHKHKFYPQWQLDSFAQRVFYLKCPISN